MDVTVICVNNLNYGMTGGQQAPSTPLGAKTTTSSDGSPEEPFNFCALAAACGAVYVARWTALHIRLLTNAITEAMQKKGLQFCGGFDALSVGLRQTEPDGKRPGYPEVLS